MPKKISAPGVFVEELPGGGHAIAGVPTSIAAFTGAATRGPVNRPMQIFNWADYQRIFGGWDGSELSYALSSYYQNGGGQAYVTRVVNSKPGQQAAAAFAHVSGRGRGPSGEMPRIWAANPGLWGNDVYVYVDPVQKGDADPAKFNVRAYEAAGGSGASAKRSVQLNEVSLSEGDNYVADQLNSMDDPLIAFADPLDPAMKASQNGIPSPTGTLGVPIGRDAFPTVAKNVGVIVTDDMGKALPAVAVDLPTCADAGSAAIALAGQLAKDPALGPLQPQVTLVDRADGQVQFRVLLSGFDHAGFRIAFSGDALGLSGGGANVQAYRLQGGNDGPPIDADSLLGDRSGRTGVYALETLHQFNILCLPDLRTFDAGAHAKVAAPALAYCAQRRAFMIVDLPASVVSARDAQQWATVGAPLLGADVTSYAAAYWPEPVIDDPLAKAAPRQIAVSGVMAGIYAQADNERGVWKAPAGINCEVSGVLKLAVRISDAATGTINALGLNAMRAFPVYGIVPWGARTLQGADAGGSEWKYVPVRRLALFLEESLERGLQWAVFEPNAEPLWSSIRLAAGAFLQNLFRQGAFAGSTPKDAYFVQCDSSTTTRDDIVAGVANVVVGFAPVKPAEYVILSIRLLVAEAGGLGKATGGEGGGRGEALAEPLKVVEVDANKWWVDTGIDVAPGDALRFEASGIWWDASYEAGPDGVDIPSLRNWRFLRRVRRAGWAELAGIVGRFGGFPIGAGTARRFASGGRLRLFFNDAFGFYHNNRGSVSVSIHRD